MNTHLNGRPLRFQSALGSRVLQAGQRGRRQGFSRGQRVLYTGIKRAAQVLRSLGYRSGSPDGLHKDGYAGSIAYDADGVKISGEKFTSVIGPLQKSPVQEELQASERVTAASRAAPAGSGPSRGRCVPDRRIHTFCGKRHSRPPACSGPAPMGCRPR